MSTAASGGSRPVDPRVLAAGRRYRVMAWIVGVGLLILTVGTVVKYTVGDPTLVAIVGPIHGFLYIGYLGLTADLAVRARWTVQRTLLIALAGTIPFLSFVAERSVTRRLQDGVAAGEPTPDSTAAPGAG